MLPFLADYLETLRSLHADMEHTLDGLPPEALDWSPGPDMNSLSVLATHVAGSERYWIGDVAGGEPSGRDREAEFRAKSLTAKALAARLAKTLAHSQAVLERLTLHDLELQRPSSMHDNRAFSVGWALAHALEHTAQHLGQMQLTRQLWEQRNA
jgi:uncharacterized damage-inducible protein DinB